MAKQGWEDGQKLNGVRISLTDAWLHLGMFSKAQESYQSLRKGLASQDKLLQKSQMNRCVSGLA